MLHLNIESLWLVGGAVLVVLEAFVAPGVGFLFAGFGAIMAGIFIGLGLIAPENYLLQFVVCFAFTALFAGLLWKKLKQFRQGKETYSNIIGDTAIVESDLLKKGVDGKVKWSGTVLQARLVQNASVVQIPAGSQVTIEELRGNIAICRPLGEEKP
jgi:membrane protein implicated in regulation of membrane protease activity